MTAATKSHDGKPRLDLLPWGPLEQVARAFELGCQKPGRGEWDWKKGARWSLYIGAAFRHLASFVLRRGPDAETGLHPLAHCIATLLILLDYEMTGSGTDDRWGG